MCGIGGIYNPQQKQPSFSILKRMLMENRRRGVYSFGFYTSSPYKTTNIEEGMKELLRRRLGEILLFQFRTPTIEVRGWVEEENPPFQHNNWVWVMNVVSNSKWWEKKKEESMVKNDGWFLGWKIINGEEVEECVFAGLFYDGKNFYVAAKGYPLHYLQKDGVWYFSSVRVGEGWQAIKQNNLFKIENGRMKVVREFDDDVPWLF